MISPLAYVDPSAQIGKNVTIHPFAYIDKNVVIGDDCVIMPYVSIMNGARIGNGNTFYQELLSLLLLRISSIRVRKPSYV